MKIIDSNADSVISKKEFENYTRKLMYKIFPDKPFSKKNFEAGYAKLDKEHLGYVEHETMKHFLTGHFKQIGLY